MDRVSEPQLDELAEKGIRTLIQVLVATLLGSAAAVVLLPRLAGPMALTLDGPEGSAFWFLSRSSAFVAYLLLWGSMMLGLAITNKMARLWPGAPATFAIHEYVSLLGLAFAAFHALILLGDHYINFTVAQILMPFSTINYRPTWTGIGQLAFYLWLIVALSFYMRARIGQKTWRSIHYLSFVLYLMGLAHGLLAGTDTAANWAHWYYWISAGSLLFLLVHRIVNTITEKLTKPAARRAVATSKPASVSAPRSTAVSVQTTPQK